MKSNLSIHGVSVGYHSNIILSGITFEVSRGEFVGIIGPNGCGKTTLLRTISRVLEPQAGAVLLDGVNVYSISSREFAKELAVVPQDTGAAFDFSVLEVVLMGRSPHLSRFEVEGAQDVELAKHALQQTSTLHLADRPVSTLSGGELQRVIIARGLAQQPQILLLDEPTSHLDLSYQFEILDIIKHLNRDKQLTVVAVLHDLNLAANYCSRVILMGEGRIQAVGSPEEVITADNIRRVYGAEVWVRRHPTTGRPYVISGVSRDQAISDSVTRRYTVHIICGGGTGAPVMAKLIRRGYSLTAGVLNSGDTDLEVAESLGIRCTTCPPFTAISEDAEAQNMEMAGSADAVVMSDLPFGQWNLPNLDAARRALELKKPLFIMRPETISSRDFTGGRAAKAVDELLRSGASPTGSLDELAAKLESAFDQDRFPANP